MPPETNPAPATRSDIVALYESLLGRKPESEAVFESWSQHSPVEIVRAITRSPEFTRRDIRSRLEALSRELSLNQERLNQLTWLVDAHQRENRLLLGALALPSPDQWHDKPQLVAGGPATNAFANSTLCRQASFEEPYFSYWAQRVAGRLYYHRKIWEFVFICQALWERGAIRPGARCLGFGVGREPLAAFFASEDCKVTATDMASEAAIEAGWSHSAQHAAGMEGLRHDRICPPERFERNVTFRVCDMNAIHDDLTGYDFCWSACALEHLGSIGLGLAFIERTLDCLKPGGWAIHTTEFNVNSNEATVDNASTVLFRQRDMWDLWHRLTAKGHTVAPFDFDPGSAPLDRYIDVAPYRLNPHLKIALAGYSATSFGLIVQKAG